MDGLATSQIKFRQKSLYREVLLFKLFLSIAKQKVSFRYLKIKVCSVDLRNPCCQFGPDTDITDGTEEIGLDPDKVDRTDDCSLDSTLYTPL